MADETLSAQMSQNSWIKFVWDTSFYFMYRLHEQVFNYTTR